ncbi:MAG TPA: glycoside hydrolase family 2 TIM barrel-domain containing protein [Actinospica sp.]|nr:glycoside hydrolase family 2 TIM barrel-domain containing protein [Actinospica sp.]
MTAIQRPWQAPELTGLGRLPMSAVSRIDGSLSLNGEWRFQLLPSPDTPLADRWTLASVPGCWTVQEFEDIHGVGPDLPQYTNVQMPWPDAPPRTPSANPTGVYERSVTIPAAWAGRRIVLHVGAAESVLLVQVGGREIGLGKDSHLASEFDITDAVIPGEPTVIRLTVIKWSDASFVEDQDQWWHAGITRSVSLYATDLLYLDDVHVARATAEGELRVDVRVRAAGGSLPAGWRISGHLEGVGELGPDTAYAAANEADERVSDWLGLARISSLIPPESLRRWTAETPELYALTVRLHRADGTVADESRCRIGFRSVEIVGRDLLVNGVRVLIRGVNRHDFDPLTGRVVSAAAMRADLVAARRFGFNAIRTSHYPNDPAFLDLTDELGFYVVDEADIETHDHAHELADDPRYLAAFTERVSRMVLRDKNHPSVILWSLGNESDYGANHDAAAGWVRHYDPTRPLHYEGAVKLGWADAGHAVSDVVCPMYSSIDAIVEHAESGTQTRPLIMCEYSHAMGNSNGTLAEYWAAIESTPGLQGGFIWEFRDHGILQRLTDGRPAGPASALTSTDAVAPAGHRWAYGGDFGDVPNDGVFCADGIFFPDRAPKPAAYEHRELAAPVRLELTEDGEVLVRNRQDFLPLDVFETERIHAASDESPDAETWLTLRVTRDGEEICTPSIQLRPETRDLLTRADATPASTRVALDADGRLLHPLLAAPLTLSLWRAPTDNDVLGGMAERWQKWGLEAPPRTLLDITDDGARTIIRAEYATSVGPVLHEQILTPLLDGGVLVEESAALPDALDDVARVGSVFETAVPYAEAEWFGKGPWETYPDRDTAPVSRHGSTIDALFTPYLRPQESGGRNAVRWITLSAPDTPALTIHLDEPRQISVTRHRAADLARAAHHDELVPLSDRCVVHVDAAHRGLGTASCGPDTLPRYRIPGGVVHRWSWTLR